MERLGSGIGFMIREMRALGRPEPEFREQNEFIVTFHLAAALSNTPTSLEVDEQVAPDMAERQIGGATSGKRALDAAQRLEAALRYVQEHGAITNKAYRNLTSVSDMTALRDLETLVTQGSLRVVGQGRGRKYTL